jgi:hypothetical protein
VKILCGESGMPSGVARGDEGSENGWALLPKQNLKALASLQGPHLDRRCYQRWYEDAKKGLVTYGFETKCTKPLSLVGVCFSLSA